MWNIVTYQHRNSTKIFLRTLESLRKKAVVFSLDFQTADQMGSYPVDSIKSITNTYKLVVRVPNVTDLSCQISKIYSGMLFTLRHKCKKYNCLSWKMLNHAENSYIIHQKRLYISSAGYSYVIRDIVISPSHVCQYAT